MRKHLIIGVMGGGTASAADTSAAYRLGELIAENGWILLNGGRNSGIMDASARGAREKGGITVGILPDENLSRASDHIDIPIVTGMGSGRNIINVLSSDVVIACPGGAGTLSEISLALKYGKPVVLLNFSVETLFDALGDTGRLFHAETPEEAVAIARREIGVG
jgi:uncharacterized protein (TIGR00725 family)